MCKTVAPAIETVETVVAAVAINRKWIKDQEDVLKKQRIVCKTVELAVETVAAALASNRKRNRKQENVSKKQRVVCKTIPLAIETVAAAVVSNRKFNTKQENGSTQSTNCERNHTTGDRDGRGSGGW